MATRIPRPDEYQLAVQNPRAAFLDPELQASRIETNGFGLPLVASGGFALTYRMRSDQGKWAVRCFKRNIPDLLDRYREIIQYLQRHPSPYFTHTEYQEHGIKVHGVTYPVVKMGWVDGVPLNLYVEQHLSQPQLIGRLAVQFTSMVQYLSSQGIAHGDLQHGNILVTPGGELRLVDYDGMFVPALAKRKSNELGHINYQHPARSINDFGPHLDRFSAIVIYVALRAIAVRPTLWTEYSAGGECLLFRQNDFLKPMESLVFQQVESQDALKPILRHFRAICGGDPASVPLLRDLGAEDAPESFDPHAAFVRPRRQYVVLRAAETDRLLENVGERVEVIGRITNVSPTKTTRAGKPYIFIDFGDWLWGCFSLVLWSEALDLFEQRRIDLEQYMNRWVSVTGIIDVYDQRPRLSISMPSEIEILGGEREAEERLLANQAPLNTAGALSTLQREQRLTQLYSKQ